MSRKARPAPRRTRTPYPGPSLFGSEDGRVAGWQYLAAFFIPLLGVVLAIWTMGSGRGSQGVALLLTALLGLIIYLAYFA